MKGRKIKRFGPLLLFVVTIEVIAFSLDPTGAIMFHAVAVLVCLFSASLVWALFYRDANLVPYSPVHEFEPPPMPKCEPPRDQRHQLNVPPPLEKRRKS